MILKIILSLVTIFLIVKSFYYFKNGKILNLMKAILEDNKILDKKTKIKIKGDQIIIKNYRLVESAVEKIIPSLIAETSTSFFIKERRYRKITIQKFPPLPTEPGIYQQNVLTGKITPFYFNRVINMFVIAKTDAGKSVLIKSLLKGLSADRMLVISPKGDEDYRNGVLPTSDVEDQILDIIKRSGAGEFKNDPFYIVLDELITIGSTFQKKTITEINRSFTISRSENLHFILASQSLNQANTGGFNLPLITTKILNVSEIKNYESTLGQDILTNPNTLKTGQFILLQNGQEFILTHKMRPDEF